MSNGKVIVIGIDGGTFDIIRPMVEKGRLPNLASIMRNGVSSELVSTIPFLTSTAFTSFMTGVNPGKHRIFGFTGNTHLQYGDGPVLNASHIGSETIWETFTRNKKRVLLSIVPFTYPPPTINGAFIYTDVHSRGRIYTYPQDLLGDIKKVIGPYKTKSPESVMKLLHSMSKETLLDDILEDSVFKIDKMKEICLYLLRRFEWDFFMTVFKTTDVIQHYYWKYMDSNYTSQDEHFASKYRDSIHDTYERVDSAIGEILAQAGKDATVVVMSDHGFGPLQKFFYVNNWLLQEGLLVLKRRSLSSKKITVIHPSMYKCLIKARLKPLMSILPRRLLEVRIPLLKRVSKSLVEMIDWGKTKAYATPIGINVNLKNREPEGIVESGDFHEVVTNIIKRLYEWDNQNQGNLIETVARKDDIYHGPYIDEAPDIIPVLKYSIPLRNVDGSDIVRDTNDNDILSGHHAPKGILLMKGPCIKPGSTVNEPEIIDIAPTILYLMKLPVLDQMDGRVLEEIIDPNYLKANPISTTKVDIRKERMDYSLSEEEDEHVRDHLKDLGYL